MALRYQIPFVSLGGKSCRVDIYDRQYTGSVTRLSRDNANTPGIPAAQPVTIEEKVSENMLDVLRHKSGYLTLYETSYGSLQSLFPQTNNQCYLYIYYNGEVVFYGYLQAQNFENSYEAAPRQIQVPFFSPLALMSNRYIDEYTDITEVTLGEILDGVLNDYDNVILPRDLLVESEEGVKTPLQMRISERIVCPWNQNYDYGLAVDGQTPSPYEPLDCASFLEGFCHFYGLVMHEWGKTVIFSRFNYESQYVRMNVGELAEDAMSASGLPAGNSVLALESYFSNRGTNSTDGAIMPLGKLTFDYGEFEEDVPMDLSRSKYVLRTAVNPLFEDFTTLAVLNPQTGEFHSSYITTASGTLTNINHVRVLGDGNREMVEVHVVIPAGQSSDVELFSYTYGDIPNNLSGAIIESTLKQQEGQQPKKLRMQVISGGKYYNTDHDWVSTPSFLPLTFDEQGKCTTYDVASNGRTLTIRIFPPEQDGVAVTAIFTAITLKVFADPLRKYEISIGKTKTIKNSIPSTEEATLDMLIHTAINNGRLATGGRAISNSYGYMFSTQLRQRRTIAMQQYMSITNLYLYKITTVGYSEKWRVVGIDLIPSEDEYTFTMHGSTTL